jgi:hypothetical protein
MNPVQSSLLIIFTILAYIIIIDENAATYLTLIFKIMRVNTERMLWMIRFHPRNPITNLMMKWKYERLARELQAEMECKATELNNTGKTD